MKLSKIKLLSVSAALMWSFHASAQFNYDDNSSELLLGFRSAGGTNDLLVNIGSASTYANATGPITISGTYFTGQQLTDAGLGLNNLYFSVFGAMFTGSPSDITLWVSAPETSGLTTPWSAQTAAQLNTSRSRIQSIGDGGSYEGFINSAGADNTATAIVTPDSLNQSGDDSYHVGMGDNGNFQGNFGSNNNIEDLTGSDFASGSTPAFLDLYEMLPNQNGTLLGTFELDPNGTLTFVPVPEPSTLATLGLGLLGLAGWRRMIRRK
jgi:hypothetical protein